jgi:acetyl-CoA synthetase
MTDEHGPNKASPDGGVDDGTNTASIDALFLEGRRYPPTPEFAAQANAQPDIYERDPDEFWDAEAKARISWFEPYHTLSEWDLPYARWYLGGRLNAAYNCVDRHVEAGRGDKVAYHWEGEPIGDTRTITFADLQREVVRFANALRSMGVGKGTPVGIYMGMVPELPIAMLACARLGAPHTVVFGGFSAESLSGRLVDMGCQVLVTQDGGWRRGKVVPLKENADAALDQAPGVKTMVVFRRTASDVTMREGRDVWWDDAVKDASDDPASCPCEPMDSEDLLYLLYSSGTTAKPKAIAHTTGGYLVGTSATHHYIFDIKPDTVYWAAADIGWVTGHSYIVYGPLANGTTGVLYEGTPDFPDKDRWWDIVERYRVDVLYTAPTAIRTHMKWGPEYAQRHDLSSLRLLGTVGEPINPEAWVWYREHIGAGRTPVVDTWWQTETGMIMITPLPGVSTLKPGSASKPFPGIEAAVYDERGNEVPPGAGGYLVLKRPWPAMLRGLYHDDERYRATYWERFPGAYFAGDGARVDEDGDLWLLGRVDDVMNVSGHRISTIEVESALVDHLEVAEAAVCGRKDATTGQAIVAFVTLKGSQEGSPEKLQELRQHVGTKIGKLAMPANIVFTPELPKTRSGKIMRRLLRDVAEQRELGDTTTLADPTVVEEIRERATADAAKEE